MGKLGHEGFANNQGKQGEPSAGVNTLTRKLARQRFGDRLNDLADKLADLHKKMSPEMKTLFNEMESYIKKHDC